MKEFTCFFLIKIEEEISYGFFAIALQGSKSGLDFKYDCDILVYNQQILRIR